MNLAELVIDPYNRRARLQPALLALLPVIVVALVLYPELETKGATLLGIVAYLGGAAWLTQLGRERGKRLEPDLYQDRGRMPSVALLRHRDGTISKQTKARYHAFLSESVPHLMLPSPEDEAASPEAADDAYAAANDWLLANTRDKDAYRLIFEENMNYGFRRNLWALKPIAIPLDILLFAGVVLLRIPMTREISAFIAALNSPTLVALGVIIAHLILLLLASKRWVRTTAEAYARQLLAACDLLEKTGNNTRSA